MERAKAIAWSDALDQYLGEVAATCKPRTHEDYDYFLRHYFRYGSSRLSDISPHDIHAMIERLAATPAVQHRAYAVLRAFLRWAHRKHYLDRNPMERMRARLLNHVSGSFGGIAGVYQRYDFMPEMRGAISKWEQHVRSLIAREP